MLQFCAALVCEGADQGGIDFIEDDAGKIVCDLFFVAAAFGDGVFKEAGLGAMLGAEGGSTKEEAEGAQSMGVVVGLDGGCQVDFVVAAGAGEGAAVVETPDAAVGEDAPADAPVRVDVGGGKIAEDLAVGRTGLAACVERQIEAFALGDGQGVGVTIGGGFGGGAVFGFGIAEEQMIGDVFVVVAALLGQVVRPNRAVRTEDGSAPARWRPR